MQVRIQYFDTLNGSTEEFVREIHEWTGAAVLAACDDKDADNTGLDVEDAAGFELEFWSGDVDLQCAAFVLRTTGLSPKREGNCAFPGTVTRITY